MRRAERPPLAALKLSPGASEPPTAVADGHIFSAQGVTISAQGVVTRSAAPAAATSTFTCGVDTAAPVPAAAPAAPPGGCVQVSFDDLELERRLGQGASACVYLARHKRTGRRFALKAFALHDDSCRSQLLTELAALYAADSDAICACHGATYREGTVAVLLDYYDLSGLDAVLARARGQPVPEGALAGVAFQALWGLAYLAFDRRLHRDVKPVRLGWCLPVPRVRAAVMAGGSRTRACTLTRSSTGTPGGPGGRAGADACQCVHAGRDVDIDLRHAYACTPRRSMAGLFGNTPCTPPFTPAVCAPSSLVTISCMQANILVDSDGRVALTDLGISKQLQDSILVRPVGRGGCITRARCMRYS